MYFLIKSIRSFHGWQIICIMPEFDPRNHFQQPSTPTAVSWFEFLLDPSLLERHFNEDDPGTFIVSNIS